MSYAFSAVADWVCRPTVRTLLPLVLLFGFSAGAASAAQPSAVKPVDYARQIKPILSNHCYACHGPDDKNQDSDLRLDLRSSAIESAIEPGDASGSELIARMTSDDPDERMPPASVKKPPPTDAQVELLRRWIDQGAKYDEHWAFVAPKQRPEPPAGDGNWARGAIDRFVAAGHARHGFEPASAADRRTLIRRLSFDLIGLPPAAAEVESFVSDESADAYEKVVDRLLASPHFGERMAIYWLDVVRYADTGGYHGDNNRDHAPYRDYVIRAFNENMPYNRFVREQIAGDLLPEATNDQKIASGFNRLNMTTREGGAQPKEYIAIYAADRVRNTNSIFLGLTMGCCQCHDHKFDPYTTKDFYSFSAFFADIKETIVGTQQPITVLDQVQTQRVFDLDQAIAAAEKRLNEPEAEWDAAQAKWESAQGAGATVSWTVPQLEPPASASDAKLAVLDDGSVLVSGSSPDKDTYTLTLPIAADGTTGLRLELLPDNSLPAKGPGRAGNGNLVLSEFEVWQADRKLAVAEAVATHSQRGYDIRAAIDNQANTGWAILPQAGKALTAYFVLKEPLAASGDAASTPRSIQIKLQQQHGDSHTLGRFRIATTTAKDPLVIIKSQQKSGPLRDALAVAADQRTAAQRDVIRQHFRKIAPETATVRKHISDAKAEKAAIQKQARKVLVTLTQNPREVRILPRGNWQDDSGEVVSAAVPAYLGKLELAEGKRGTRLELADWLAAPDNPLTARVFVNRLWKLMFGRGLVKSLDDFGAQGELPTHPELLDWLAVEFVESGWDVKRLLRQMVTSSTYRQSSNTTPEMLGRDPHNRRLARQGRFRLDAELIRDNALAISGLLVPKIGGVSVRPYQPAGYLVHLNFPKRTYQHDKGDNQYRRGVYTFWQRTFLHPAMALFDAPTREECTVERPQSNTPLQALLLLNDPTYVEAARMFAVRILQKGGDEDGERLAFAYRQALARELREGEAPILLALLNRHREHYREAATDAKEIQKVGLAATPADLDPVELAAWTSVARTIFNLHETITRN